MYLYVYPNHRCRTVVEYTCIQLHMSLIQTIVDDVFVVTVWSFKILANIDHS